VRNDGKDSLIFIDKFTSEAESNPILSTGKRFLKEWDDISEESADSGSWICVNELYM